MFRNLNLHFFAGFILSFQTSILVAILYGLALTPFIPFPGGGMIVGAIPFIMGIAALVGFISTLLGFFMVMTARIWGARFNPNSEGYWVYSIAAMSANFWLMADFQKDLLFHYLANLGLSLLVIFLGNRFIYRRIRERLEKLLLIQ